MGRKKLLAKLAAFFDMDARQREKNKEEMAELLTRLKQKELELKAQLEQEADDEKKVELMQRIDLVHSQRKKGVAVLKELRSESDSSSE